MRGIPVIRVSNKEPAIFLREIRERVGRREGGVVGQSRFPEKKIRDRRAYTGVYKFLVTITRVKEKKKKKEEKRTRAYRVLRPA